MFGLVCITLAVVALQGTEADGTRQLGAGTGGHLSEGYGYTRALEQLSEGFAGQLRGELWQEPQHGSEQPDSSGSSPLVTEPGPEYREPERTVAPRSTATPVPAPTQPRAQPPAASNDAAVRAHLARIKACESGGIYNTNTGNGFYGAYQFTLSTWAGVGGTGYPHLASPEEQDLRAYILYTQHGPSHWPVCQYY